MWQGDVHGKGVGVCMVGGHAWQGGMPGRGVCLAGKTAIAAGSTHPTGMDTC